MNKDTVDTLMTQVASVSIAYSNMFDIRNEFKRLQDENKLSEEDTEHLLMIEKQATDIWQGQFKNLRTTLEQL